MVPFRTLPVRVLTIASLLGIVALFVAWNQGTVTHVHADYHSKDEVKAFRDNGLPLVSGENNFFKGSGNCYGCHGPDEFNNYAGVDSQGRDVNVSDDWRSTMMANSARDPFWKAKVSHEVSVNPAHQIELEDKCLSCHAPQGKFDRFYMGQEHYSMADLAMDPIAQDGVSCLACHMQSADSLDQLFSGKLKFDTNNVVYGPYGDVFGSPMTSFIGFEPLFGAHLNESGLCSGCHTLVTETADLDGNLTGDEFVEQATYHEWLNSDFNTNTNPEGGVSCQSCHLPRIDDAIVISANYLFLEGRSPYGLHHMAGANTYMLELLRDNATQLGLTASTTQFDSTIARTNRLLTQNTLLLDADVVERNLDTAFIDLKLTNLGGHKFPSGYPARRAFVELIVLNANDDTLFRSGGWDDTFEVIGHDPSWEPHYDVIRSPDQAQIYEMVMGDVNGNRTTVLERAKTPLKDNRLTPLGFTTTHISYDTTLIAGVPATDIDFNRYSNGTEGSGSDIVHFHVPMYGHSGLIRVVSRVWYQSAPPRYMDEMFTFSTPDINTFRTMYQNSTPAPVLIKEVQVTDLSVGVDDLRQLGVRIFPNPIRNGQLSIDGLSDRITSIEVYTMSGALITRTVPAGQRSWKFNLPAGAATYVVVVRTGEKTYVQRVVAL